MNPQRLDYLSERYLKEQCTPDELAEFEAWIIGLENPSVELQYKEGTPQAEAYVNVQYERFRARRRKARRAEVIGVWMKVAVALVIVAAGIVYFLVQKKYSHVSEPPAVVSYDSKANQAANSRYVLLPDSSIVILHAGSRITFDTSSFNVSTRSVTLIGEAYFDVRHNPATPFIIQAGETKTTVLGTAFNIRQQADSVVVTVARGSVRVENSKKVIAVLMPGQQVAYNQQDQQAVAQTTTPQQAIHWMQDGLSFQDKTLKTIVEQLQERYQTTIMLQTPALEHCRVTVVAPFTGTESLEELLATICPIINANYTKESDRIIIQGAGCPSG